ncbi:MAG: hypothetical protein L7W43_20375 [Rubripirellula sp.]|nr:hypothetical protein [Rubripirellula sp.]
MLLICLASRGLPDDDREGDDREGDDREGDDREGATKKVCGFLSRE